MITKKSIDVNENSIKLLFMIFFPSIALKNLLFLKLLEFLLIKNYISMSMEINEFPPSGPKLQIDYCEI